VEEDFIAGHSGAGDVETVHGGKYELGSGLNSGEVADSVTQRLLSSLLDDDAGLRQRVGMPSTAAEMCTLAKGMSSKVSMQALEKEVRQCVVALGLFDGPETIEEDKVLIQLQHQQHTLRLQNLNISAKFIDLHSKVSNLSAGERNRERMKWIRPEEAVDSEIEECYHRRQVYVRRNQEPPAELLQKIRVALARRTALLSGKRPPSA
jgi:hypothetical protein